MSKSKPLTHLQIQEIINNCLGALARAKGQRVADETEVYYRKGNFHIRPQGCSPDYFAVGLKPAEIQAKTDNLNSGGRGQ